MPAVALGNVSQAQCMTEGAGLASGDRWSPGAAGLRRRLPRADAPARLPAARSAPRAGPHGHPPQRTPRTGQCANGQRARAPGRRAQAASTAEAPSWPVAVMVRGLPSPAVGLSGRNGTRQERFASLRDRLRRLLMTEPAAPGFWCLSGEGEEWSAGTVAGVEAPGPMV